MLEMPDTGVGSSGNSHDIRDGPLLSVSSQASSISSTGNGEEEEDDALKVALELKEARQELIRKDEEIARLSGIRDEVEAELSELTASLFEEAHKMVREANVKQASAEKKATEARMKMEGLTTEVAALKVMVLTSTPSHPNKHLHPQIDPKKSKGNNGSSSPSSNGGSFIHHSRSDSNTSSEREDSINPMDSSSGDPFISIDPLLFAEYSLWKEKPCLNRVSHPFLDRIFREDFETACEFGNKKDSSSLKETIYQGILRNALSIHPISKNAVETKDCALFRVPLPCQYRVRIEEDGVSHDISLLARNRIIAVCDCLNYLRYVTQGLVKSSDEEVFREIMNLRKKILMARLGFKPET